MPKPSDGAPPSSVPAMRSSGSHPLPVVLAADAGDASTLMEDAPSRLRAATEGSSYDALLLEAASQTEMWRARYFSAQRQLLDLLTMPSGDSQAVTNEEGLR
jgi:hypothetical protein